MPKQHAMGTRIRELRQERGLSLDDVAAAGGVSASHLSRIERGQTGPSFTVASRLAATLAVRPSDLATFQRQQSTTDTELMAALTARGLDPKIAEEITRTISTPARRALVETLDSNSV